jgi:hypothetical protein
MIKKLLFIAALLVPGLAYGGNSSADLSVQVVPAGTAGTCGATGQVATDLQTVGFTTVALCNDFTTPIPNTVGTGLPSNWLDCGFGGDTSSIWHFGVRDRNRSPGSPTCGSVFQTTDPTYGNKALDLQVSYSDALNTAYGNPGDFLATINYNGTGGLQFPDAYYEITFRCNPYCGNGNADGDNQNFWSWVATNLQGGSGLVEVDFLETLTAQGDMGANTWSTTDCGSGFSRCWGAFLYAASGDITQYHTWGTLFTGNGSGGWSVCWYYDGTRYGCRQGSYPSDAASSAKRYLRLENQVNFTNPPQSPAWVGGNSNYYVKSVKVISCANWKQAGAAGMCNGSTFNGNFYCVFRSNVITDSGGR